MAPPVRSSAEAVFTKQELVEMWNRPVERQYNIAMTKIFQAIKDCEGDISLCFSGGKDSSLLLDMFCEIWKSTPYADQPVKVRFADTTNETRAMLRFIDWFIPYMEQKHGVMITFQSVKSPKGLSWAKFVLDNGIPLIGKMQAKAIRTVNADMTATGCDYETVVKLARPEMSCVNELFDIGFSKTSVQRLTGYISYKGEFGNKFRLAKRWLPMVACPVHLTEQCCVKIKEAALDSLHAPRIMTGEQAAESASREAAYLKTGCNIRLPDGGYRSKPLGAMTLDGVLYALKYRGTPICSDYGEIVRDGCHYTCTKAIRTGCALCGFGCQYDPERFIRLQETELAKVQFAFRPRDRGGAGYKEAIEYMNEYCKTKILVPNVR